MVRLGQRLAFGIGGFDAGIDPIAFIYKIGEKSELADGTSDFALAASLRQAGLLGGTADKRGGRGFNPGGNFAQELGFCFPTESGKAGRRRRFGSRTVQPKGFS